jgi:hypothetical protein
MLIGARSGYLRRESPRLSLRTLAAARSELSAGDVRRAPSFRMRPCGGLEAESGACSQARPSSPRASSSRASCWRRCSRRQRAADTAPTARPRLLGPDRPADRCPCRALEHHTRRALQDAARRAAQASSPRLARSSPRYLAGGTVAERPELKQSLGRLLGPSAPEVGCDVCFDELDRYVELESPASTPTRRFLDCVPTWTAARPAARSTTACTRSSAASKRSKRRSPAIGGFRAVP